jgi:hypothetical protein
MWFLCRIIVSLYRIFFKSIKFKDIQFKAKDGKSYGLITTFFLFLVFGFVFMYICVPSILELPIVISGNYPHIEGNVVEHSVVIQRSTGRKGGGSRKSYHHYVSIYNEITNETITLDFNYSGTISVGDYIELIYLPYTKRIRVISHNSRNLNSGHYPVDTKKIIIQFNMFITYYQYNVSLSA